MAKFISKSKMEELEDACTFGIEGGRINCSRKRCGMEGDYISREAALEITTRTCGDYAAAFAEIRKLPAADVAEVVRCKNCK